MTDLRLTVTSLVYRRRCHHVARQCSKSSRKFYVPDVVSVYANAALCILVVSKYGTRFSSADDRLALVVTGSRRSDDVTGRRYGAAKAQSGGAATTGTTDTAPAAAATGQVRGKRHHTAKRE